MGKLFYPPWSWTGSWFPTFTSRFKCARTGLSKGHIEFKTAGFFIVRWVFVRRWLLLHHLILIILLIRGIIVCVNGDMFCYYCTRFYRLLWFGVLPNNSLIVRNWLWSSLCSLAWWFIRYKIMISRKTSIIKLMALAKKTNAAVL